MDKTETRAQTRLFGTDGVRGKAGTFPLDRATVRRLGAALVRALPHGTEEPHLLIGRDTRESGVWIEAELAHGAAGEGASVTSVGVVPTPAVAYLTRAFEDYDAGVVISASHNPFEDNGIKVFSGRGEKFTEKVERQVEAIVADQSWTVRDGTPDEVPGRVLVDAYLHHLRGVLPDRAPFRNLKLAIDCAHGATTTVAPELFASLGFETIVIGNRPDGRNINLACGSTHPEALASTVVESGAALGVAFDGDGDRAIFVDHLGRVVNGDAVLLMCARHLLREGRLPGNAIVATVMSNIGLEIGLRESGIDVVRCPVGDKLFTGDGLCTALNVLRVVAASGRPLAELADDLVTFPQVLLNVRVREKAELATVPAVQMVVAQVERRVAGHGRLLVRYSGTEPLLRVMIEGRDEDEIRAWAQEIVDVVKEELG